MHGDNWESLYKQIPKKLLPSEYGGDAGPIQNLIDEWEQKVIANRDYLMDEVNYRSDESKRIGRSKHLDSLSGLEGSFRKLNVD